MKEEQLQRLMRLSRRLESPLVILDEVGGGSVLVSLDEYETLLGQERGSSASERKVAGTITGRQELPAMIHEEVIEQKERAPDALEEMVFQPISEREPEVKNLPITETDSGSGEPDIEAQFYLEPVE